MDGSRSAESGAGLRRNWCLSSAAGLEKEPGAPLGVIDEIFKQARSGYIAVLVAQFMRFPHAAGESLVVVPALAQHVERIHVFGVIVEDALQSRYMPDGAERCAAHLPHALGQDIGRREDLVRLFVQQEVIVAKVRAAYVPVEVLRLQVEGERVR